MSLGTLITNFFSLLMNMVLFLALSEFRYSKKVVYISSFLLMGSLIFINLFSLFFIELTTLTKISLFTIIIPSFLFFLSISKYRRSCFIFTFCTVDIITICIMTISSLITVWLSGNQLLLFFIRMLLFVIAAFLTIYKVSSPYKEVITFFKKGKDFFLFAILSIILYIETYLIMWYPTPLHSRPDDILIALIYILMLILIYVIIFLTFYRSYHLFISQLHEQELSAILKLQSERLEAQSNNYELAKIYRHDMRHHFMEISGLLNNGQVAEALYYMSQIEQQSSYLELRKFCHNIIADVILSSYAQKTEQHHILFMCQAHIPGNLPILDAELSVILSNILENAYESCLKIEDIKKRYIHFYSTYNGNSLVIEVKNSTWEKHSFDRDSLPISTKKNSRRIGTKSIRSLAIRYNGIAEFCSSQNEFVTHVLLNFK